MSKIRADILEQAHRLRPVIEKAAESLSDYDASIAPALFPALKQDGRLVSTGTRINWRGTIKRAAVDLWDTADNDPDHAPTLWEDIAYRDGIRIIPDVLTVGTAFALGERGWWGNILFESTLADNVFTPEQYRDGWKEVNYEVEAK